MRTHFTLSRLQRRVCYSTVVGGDYEVYVLATLPIRGAFNDQLMQEQL